MRIGIIAPPWLPVPPGRYGGTEVVVDGLCRGLVRLGHDVTLVAPMGSRCPVPTIPLRVTHQLGMGHAVIEAPYAIRAYQELHDADADVIHDHTQIGFLLHQPNAQRVVTTNHNLFDPQRQEIYRVAASRGVEVVAISQHHASTATDVPIAGVVHNGIDVDAIPVGKGDGGYACVLSRMAPAKGIREAILIARKVGIPVHIAAKMQTAPERQYFDEQIHELIDGKDVIFRNELDARDKYEMLGGAVALLNPLQWHEPFGLAMIEALACGTPVLATLMGSAPEVIAHGITGRVRNHWSMLVSDLEQIHEIDRATCRQVAEERFGIARMASAYLDLYQQHTTEQEAAA